MGMYTELEFDAKLKATTPEKIINILNCTSGEEKDDHEFFSTENRSQVLCCSRTETREDRLYLHTECVIKNYHSEIEKFVNWIMPYIDAEPGEVLGHYIFETEDEFTAIICGETMKC